MCAKVVPAVRFFFSVREKGAVLSLFLANVCAGRAPFPRFFGALVFGVWCGCLSWKFWRVQVLRDVGTVGKNGFSPFKVGL